MRKILVSFFVGYLISLPVFAKASQLRSVIKLLPEVYIKSFDTIKIKDVCKTSPKDIAHIPITGYSKVSEKVIVNRAMIRKALLKAGMLEKYRVKGANLCILKLKQLKKSSVSLKDLILRKIKYWYKGKGDSDFKILITKKINGRKPEDILLPSIRDVMVTIKKAAAKDTYTAVVKILKTGKIIKKYYVPFKIIKRKLALFIKRDVRRGERITRADIAITDTGIENLSAGMLVEPEKIKRAGEIIALKDIEKGSVLTKKYIREKPLINAGQIITIKYIAPPLKMELKGMALMNGYRGDIIRVKNLGSRKTLKAKVISNTTVLIEG